MNYDDLSTEEFDALSEEEQQAAIASKIEIIKSKLPKTQTILNGMVNSIKSMIKEDDMGEESILAAINSVNQSMFGNNSEMAAFLLSLATFEMAKREIEFEKPTTRFADGTVILASLNIGDGLDISSDIMREWSQLYFGINLATQSHVKQIRIDDMLFLVTDSEKEEKTSRLRFSVGNNPQQLNDYLLQEGIPDVVRKTIVDITNKYVSSKDFSEDDMDVQAKIGDLIGNEPGFREEPPLPGLDGVRVFSYGFPKSDEEGED